MSGSTVGGVIGGAIGFFVGGPTGAYYGWIAGSAIGGYVDPTQIQGPRLQDMRGQSSAVGGPIPRAWGTAPVPCNVIWQQPGVTEHKHTDDGKGSGTETVTFTYTRSYAVMFHIGEIAGVLQIKRNGKIVYDNRDDATLISEYGLSGLSSPLARRRIQAQRAENAKWLAKATIYNGTQTQNPDPTIEAYKGIGNVPSYRGRSYMVVTDDETQAGEIAQFEIVISVCADTNVVDGWSENPFNWMIQSDLSGGRLYVASVSTSWTNEFTLTGRYTYATTYGRNVILSNSIFESLASYTDDYGLTFQTITNWPPSAEQIAPPIVLTSGRMVVLQTHGSNSSVFYSDDPITGSWTSVALGMGANFIAGDDSCIIVSSTTGSRKVSTDRAVSFGSALPGLTFTCTSLGHKDGLFVFGAISTEMPRWSDDNGTTLNVATGSMHSGSSISMYPLPDGSWVSVASSGAVSTTDAMARSEDGKTGWATVTTPSIFFDGGEAQRIIERGGEVIAAGKDSSGELQIIRSTNNGATWSAVTHGYVGFVDAGTGVMAFPVLPAQVFSIPDAPGYYTTPDGEVIYPGYTTLTPCATTTIGEVIGEICDLSGLSTDEYDVSELTDILPGYVVARETDGLSVIESLRPIGMFDPAEWDKKQRFIKRGGTSRFAINGDDLVERDGDAFERQLAQEAELLRRVSVGYLDPNASWAPNTQKWERRVGTINARGESTIEISAVLGADQAATAAKRRGLTAWGEPEKQKFSLPYRLASVTPTDIGTFTDDDGEIHFVRVMQVDDDSGVRLIESANNSAEAYSATATGATPKSPTITDESLRGPTILYAMNLDSLRAQDNVPGMYVAACGILAGWPGCSVELSTDGGATFRPILNITTPATMGYLTDTLNNDSNGGEPIQVFLYAGAQLSSVTAQQIADGANAAAIVTADVGEVVQFQTATATSTGWDLTDLTRGVNDTVPVQHFYGDPFVLLDASVVFVPIDSIFSGQTLIFRGIANGTSTDAAVEFQVVYEPPSFVIDGGGA